MHKPASVQENEIHNIIRDFEIQTNHRIQDRKLELVLIKKNLLFREFRHSNETQSENKIK